MFTALENRLEGKTTSRVERLFRTVNMRVNVSKWRALISGLLLTTLPNGLLKMRMRSRYDCSAFRPGLEIVCITISVGRHQERIDLMDGNRITRRVFDPDF